MHLNKMARTGEAGAQIVDAEHAGHGQRGGFDAGNIGRRQGFVHQGVHGFYRNFRGTPENPAAQKQRQHGIGTLPAPSGQHQRHQHHDIGSEIGYIMQAVGRHGLRLRAAQHPALKQHQRQREQ